MSAIAAVKAYFDAWNARSPEAIVASMIEGGTYEDPNSGGPISGPALAAYTGALFAAFPDLSFELVSEAETGPNSLAAQWIMRGTNTGPHRGAPPTGRAIEGSGADLIVTELGKVKSVRGYYDSAEVPRQLGMRVSVTPTTIGPVAFGDSLYMSLGNQKVPGAFSITSLRIRDQADTEGVQDYSRRAL